MANDPEKAAQMTNSQFCALARHLNGSAMSAEVASLACNRSATCNLETVRRWTLNGWNTEKVLRLNVSSFSPADLNCCVHWAFPQAYYSVFCNVLALFNVIGRSETKHAAVIKQFGKIATEGNRFPSQLSFFADGTVKNMVFSGVSRAAGVQTIHYNKLLPASVENQIAQFLSATREKRLDYLKNSNFKKKFKTKRGGNRKNLTEANWQQVSDSLGVTSLLSLLYRKRITANYNDIGTIISDYLDGEKLIIDLIAIVRSCNMTIEHLIYSAIGDHDFEALHQNNPNFNFVVESREMIDAV